MFCTFCGSELKVGARFCSACGGEARRRSVKAQGPSQLELFVAHYRADIAIAALLIAFVLRLASALLSGLILLLLALRKKWWYTVGGLLGVLLFLASLFLSANIHGDKAAWIYFRIGMDREWFYMLARSLLAILFGLEAWRVIVARRKRVIAITATVVFLVLAALPGYQAALEVISRHTLSEQELATIMGLLGEQAGQRFVVQEGRGPGREQYMDLSEVSVSSDEYGEAVVIHEIALGGAKYRANVRLRYEQWVLPEKVSYQFDGRSLKVAYAGADSLLIWDSARNPNGPPISAISADLITRRANALRDHRQALFDQKRDSLHLILRTFSATIHGGYCKENCYLTVADSAEQWIQARCSLMQIPGGDLNLFVQEAQRDRTVWMMTTRRTLQATAQEVESGVWTELDEVVSLTPKVMVVEALPEVQNPRAVSPKASVAKPSTERTVRAVEEGKVDEPAEFPGGSGGLNGFIRRNLKYPEEELKNGRSGMVVVEFLIRADGSIQGPSVVRSVSTALDREALRIVSTMPPWIPAKAGGRAVATKQQVPVRFTIR